MRPETDLLATLGRALDLALRLPGLGGGVCGEAIGRSFAKLANLLSAVPSGTVLRLRVQRLICLLILGIYLPGRQTLTMPGGFSQMENIVTSTPEGPKTCIFTPVPSITPKKTLRLPANWLLPL